MHSLIFQITEEIISETGLLTEDTIDVMNSNLMDYCTEIDEDARNEGIKSLVEEVLPTGMFTIKDKNQLVFNGGINQWAEKYLSEIQSIAMNLTPTDIGNRIGGFHKLERLVKDALKTDYLFYMDNEGYKSYAEESSKFMRMVYNMKPGTILYIGGVVDYHS